MTWRPIAMIAVLSIVACGEDAVLTPSVPNLITQVGTASGTPGWLLDDPIAVKVLDYRGDPVADAVVTWQTSEAGAWLGAETSTTDTEGIAKVEFAPGWKLGAQKVKATAGALEGTASVDVSSLALVRVAGGRYSEPGLCGLDVAGKVFCWWHEITWSDRLYSVIPSYTIPLPVDPDVRYRDIELSPTAANEIRFCGTTVSGYLRCWALPAAASFAAAGTSITSTAETAPVPLIALASGDYGNQGRASFCALDAERRVWCRGTNNYGELGDGTRVPHDEFREVVGDIRLKRLVSDNVMYCGLDADDHAWCWGGEFGDPVNAPMRMGGDRRYFDIGFVDGTACGIEMSSTQLYCWGYPAMDGMDPNATAPWIDPVQVPGAAGLAQLVGGSGGQVAIFRWDGGRVGYAGWMLHDMGFNGRVGRPLDSPRYSDSSWEAPPLLERVISRNGEQWCGLHPGGATLCARRAGRMTGVPLPK